MAALSACSPSGPGYVQGHVLIESSTSGGGLATFPVTVALKDGGRRVVASRQVVDHGIAPGTSFRFTVTSGIYHLDVLGCSKQVTVRPGTQTNVAVVCEYSPPACHTGSCLQPGHVPQTPALNLTNSSNGASFQVHVGDHVDVVLTPDPARWASISPSPPGAVLEQIGQTSTTYGEVAASFLVVQAGTTAITGIRQPVCPPGSPAGCASPAPFEVTLLASP